MKTGRKSSVINPSNFEFFKSQFLHYFVKKDDFPKKRGACPNATRPCSQGDRNGFVISLVEIHQLNFSAELNAWFEMTRSGRLITKRPLRRYR